ncbi:cadherin-like domain-containing protein [Asticcacaulis sp. AC402]|uniref:cadherin-like domain-containing protein n=1 Tax=Asticcacaulis sp. AC402 TaxID=1282361 RepID=UPI000404FD70|nr:cadherin-like domain-containing protein [Asticcacaulis sp. AC402]
MADNYADSRLSSGSLIFGFDSFEQIARSWTFTADTKDFGDEIVTRRFTGDTHAVCCPLLYIAATSAGCEPILHVGSQAPLPSALRHPSNTFFLSLLTTGYSDAADDVLSIPDLAADHGTIVADLDDAFSVTPQASFFGHVKLSSQSQMAPSEQPRRQTFQCSGATQ